MALTRSINKQIGVFALIHLAALAALFVPTRAGVAAFAVAYVLTGCLGITVGYHRLLTHRAWSAPRWLTRLLALIGTLALQGGALRWAALHRAHHRYEDGEGDPHARSRGFWWSHCAWIFQRAPNGFRFRRLAQQVPDLSADPVLVFLDRHDLAINAAAFLLALPLLGIEATLWAFPLRIVAVWHVTWLINSVAHAPPSAHDGARGSSRNLHWLAWLSFGEGFHANHHARPASPDFRPTRLSFDAGYAVVATLSRLGLGSIKTEGTKA